MATKLLHIDRTETSPQIDMDLEQGTLEFVGRSLPANSEQFYSRVYRWLDEYLRAPREETTVNMKLDYLETSSSKHLYNIFDRLNAVNERGQRVHVNWHFLTSAMYRLLPENLALICYLQNSKKITCDYLTFSNLKVYSQRSWGQQLTPVIDLKICLRKSIRY